MHNAETHVILGTQDTGHFPILLTDDCIFMISVNFIKKNK